MTPDLRKRIDAILAATCTELRWPSPRAKEKRDAILDEIDNAAGSMGPDVINLTGQISPEWVERLRHRTGVTVNVVAMEHETAPVRAFRFSRKVVEALKVLQEIDPTAGKVEVLREGFMDLLSEVAEISPLIAKPHELPDPYAPTRRPAILPDLVDLGGTLIQPADIVHVTAMREEGGRLRVMVKLRDGQYVIGAYTPAEDEDMVSAFHTRVNASLREAREAYAQR